LKNARYDLDKTLEIRQNKTHENVHQVLVGRPAFLYDGFWPAHWRVYGWFVVGCWRQLFSLLGLFFLFFLGLRVEFFPIFKLFGF
jgi:hypothetical protein